MTKIPRSCSPVNAQSELELVLLKTEVSLQQSIALELTNLLVAIVQHVPYASTIPFPRDAPSESNG